MQQLSPSAALLLVLFRVTGSLFDSRSYKMRLAYQRMFHPEGFTVHFPENMVL